MRPNKVKGEFAIALDGADHIMRPSYEAIVAIETETGKSVIALANDATNAALTVREMATIAGECVREYGRQESDASHQNVNDAAVQRCIVEMGPLHALSPIQDMLIKAATGGITATGKPKAPTTTAKTSEQGAGTAE
ncbi:GTA-gp10 family protein [Sphingomonas nostoxanthinifaciens]|uniref:GTA-gp10 family protein n=1 Tax=Sphingomonas nostoxanthinifaciens TaxID=2872652 RepID=UPI001CC21D1E|nr:GTA-gp10 family protein [Sphingomonas nostoxanthinifaciens]UAK23671.1 GTA-gp10 family protein [Sphingomonas nostoxanthinifaciens]